MKPGQRRMVIDLVGSCMADITEPSPGWECDVSVEFREHGLKLTFQIAFGGRPWSVSVEFTYDEIFAFDDPQQMVIDAAKLAKTKLARVIQELDHVVC